MMRKNVGPKIDKEMEHYRQLIEPATEFREGFGWTTVAGILFCGLVMLPGGIYLSLMTGAGLNVAASWVTVILFMEIARRALKPLSRQNLVVLLHAAYIMLAGHIMFPGGPMGELVYRAYLVSCEAVRDAGMLGAFPSWFAPAYDSPAILDRNLLHKDWVIPIAITFFMYTVSILQRYTLGYFFFRLTSDVEKLPYPLAPVQAQGAMALAEAELKGAEEDTNLAVTEKKTSSRWRHFSLGAYIGIGFGILQIGVPAISGLFLAKPFFIIPQPFIETTTITEKFLPATPTGLAIDIGILITGMVLPFWAVIGSAIAIVFMMIANPLLYHAGILHTWQPGMDTVNATFSNNIDFWLSFVIGAGFGIAAISVVSTIRSLGEKTREIRSRNNRADSAESMWTPPRGDRGDFPLWIAIAAYLVSAVALVVLCWWLVPHTAGVLFFLVFFAFLFNPFITYINARLLGMSGMTVQFPYIKEVSFLLSGAQGIDIWLAPIPIVNYGYQSQSYRVNELTGVNFWSLIKTDLVALPIIFVLSLAFWGFIWHSNSIPSEVFPAAQVNWELYAKNQVLIFSSTFVPPGSEGVKQNIMDSEFMKAIHPVTIGSGFFGIIILFLLFTVFGFPVMIIYGMMRPLSWVPHFFILEIAGALLARFYFNKKYGAVEFGRIAPTILAGYFTGVGLAGMATIALNLIKSAITSAPF